MTDQLNSLPPAWIATSLGQVIDYGSNVKADPDTISDDTWVLELEDIQKETSKVLERVVFAERKSKSTKNRFETGDILYGKLRPYLNKIVIADRPGVCTTEIVPLKPNLAINGTYLFYWLKHPTFLDYVNSVSYGVNMPRLGTDAGKSAPLVLAPRAEQKRIAEKLDTVLARVDACRERLDRVALILKRFRQSVLAAGVSGKLTEDWQDKEITNENWMIKPLSALGVVSGGLTKNSKRDDLPIKRPYLRVANVYANELRLGEIKKIGLTESEFKKTKLQCFDLLIVEGNGSIDQIGRVAMWRAEIADCSHQNHLIRWRANPLALPKFILFCLLSPDGRKKIVDVASSTTGLHTLSVSKVAALQLAVPPIAEQHEIVRRVETLFAFADRLEARLATARTAADRLTPALLAKAFRGELVPQDPNDEPASVLLQRLAAAQSEGRVKPKRIKKAASKTAA